MFDLFEELAIATCVGCGCTDDRACPGGCAWMRLDRGIRRGVCTQCVDRVAAWDEGSVAANDRGSPADEREAQPFTYRPVSSGRRCMLLQAAPLALQAARADVGRVVALDEAPRRT